MFKMWLFRSWAEERGSQSLEAAGVSIATAVAALSLIIGIIVLSGPGVQRTLSCAVAIVTGGGACGAGSDIPTGGNGGSTDTGNAGADTPSGGEQAASIGLDFIPFVGEIKGMIEVFTGRDLVTGEELGAWRFAGLAGLIGLNELKLLRHGDDVLRHVDDIDDLFRHGDDVPNPRRIPCVGSVPTVRVRSLGARAASSGCYKIADSRGLSHSFDRHAHEWFGRRVPQETHMAQWQALIERAARSNQVFDWSTGADATIAHLARIDGKYFVVQFYKTGDRAGELATAFVPSQRQLSAMLKKLGHQL